MLRSDIIAAAKEIRVFAPLIGAPEQFAVLRDFLRRMGYTSPGIGHRLGMATLDEMDLSDLPLSLGDRLTTHDALDLTIRLFVTGNFVEAAETDRKLTRPVWEAIRALGLVAENPRNAKQFSATVALYPVGDVFIISDRWSSPDGSEKKSFADIVYPALSPNTRELLSWLPEEKCGEFLELCGGAGAAALQSARFAQMSYSADLTARSALFAKFNGALNGISNFESLEGDLYAPVRGKTFDRIAAHPPYVPVLRQRDIFYGGGEDGEEISRRIVQEAPRYLRPGGRLYCRTLGTDREGAPFEKRVREWLGEKQSEFDVAIFISKNIEPFRFAVESAVKSGGGAREVKDWKKVFGHHGIQDLLVGLVLLQRVKASRPVFTLRRTMGKTGGRAAIEWIVRLEEMLQRENAVELLLAAKPRASQFLNLNIRHQVEGGELVPREISASTPYPFPLDTKLQPWMCSLVCRCDGSHTIAKLHEICKESGWIQPDTPMEQFARLAGILISGGFLEIEQAKLPRAEG